ncbi:MAG: hypothetical protein P4M12_08640 [Gammaproteobacteria bacterium]|nr:hypothetical protein [Gammaproteobacteria bacterium]
MPLTTQEKNIIKKTLDTLVRDVRESFSYDYDLDTADGTVRCTFYDFDLKEEVIIKTIQERGFIQSDVERWCPKLSVEEHQTLFEILNDIKKISDGSFGNARHDDTELAEFARDQLAKILMNGGEDAIELGIRDSLKGLWNTFAHPINTVQTYFEAIKHPITTGKNLVQFAYNNPVRFVSSALTSAFIGRCFSSAYTNLTTKTPVPPAPKILEITNGSGSLSQQVGLHTPTGQAFSINSNNMVNINADTIIQGSFIDPKMGIQQFQTTFGKIVANETGTILPSQVPAPPLANPSMFTLNMAQEVAAAAVAGTLTIHEPIKQANRYTLFHQSSTLSTKPATPRP